MGRNVREKRRIARFRNGPGDQIGSQGAVERLPIDISLPCRHSHAHHSRFILRAAAPGKWVSQWPEASFANLAEGLSVCAAISKKVCTDVHATSVRLF